MKIYVSGAISGMPIEKVKYKFNWHSSFLRSRGFEVINPMDVSPFKDSKKWADYMRDGIGALLDCGAIYMLSDWGQSRGARIEYAIAKEMGLKIYHQGDI